MDIERVFVASIFSYTPLNSDTSSEKSLFEIK